MKKIKSLLLSVLALGCLAMASCVPKGDEKYTVTLMYNGEVISTMEKDKATHLDAPAAPTKDGYTFKGWFVDEALTIPYTPDLLSANLTLYAKFEANTLYITFNLNGGTMEESKVAVKTGEAYTLPTPTKEGYTFAGWTLDGEEFAASGTYNRTGSVRVSASWTINKYTVTFTDGTATLATVENVEHGTKVQAWNNPAPGYEVVGIYTDAEKTTEYDFDTPVTGALTLYVKVQAKTFNITVNQDGDVSLDTTAVYGGAYTLEAAPTREGYFFRGYTMNDQTFAATGTYTWTTDIVVVATWEKDPAFGKSTVFFYDGTAEIASLRQVVDDGSALTKLEAAPAKAGYTFNGWYTDSALTTAFVSGAVVNDDMSLYAKYTPNTYTLNVNLLGGTINDQDTYSVPVVYGTTYSIPTPVRNGYKFVGFKYGNNAFAASGAYTYADSISVTAVWEKLVEDPEENGDETFLTKNNFFKERADKDDEFAYVFVAGVPYDFSSGAKSVTLKNATGVATQTGVAAFTANAVGSFQLEITRVDSGNEITYTRQAKVVKQISSFTFSSDYQTAWNNSTNNFRNDFMDKKANAVMSVGATNFIPDVKVAMGATPITVNEAYLTVSANVAGVSMVDGVVTFDSSLIGQTVTLQLKPKYTLQAAHELTMTVKVNGGVNVYDDASLRAAYGDLNVREINLLRNVKATMPADRIHGNDANGNPVPKNEYENGVYTRIVAASGDSVVVNGNFFKIDGSALPLGNNAIDGHEWGASPKDNTLAPYFLNNMQIGIFLYHNIINGKYDNGSQATFNDLYITGNYTGEAYAVVKNFTSGGQTGDYLVYSGAYHGILARGGKVAVDNATIIRTNIALFSDSDVGEVCNNAQPTQWTVNHAKLDYSWSNQAYGFGLTKFTFTNSYLGSCAGAAIHFDDHAVATDVCSELAVDNTRIENWITGEETYFASRGMSPLATDMKAAIEGTLVTNYSALLTGVKVPFVPVTIIQKDTQEVEYMNLVLLYRSTNSENAEWLNDPHQMPYVKVTGLNEYLDTMKAATALAKYQQGGAGALTADDFTAFNAANAPTDDKQAFMMFNTGLTGASYPVDYMCGYVEMVRK